MKIRIKRRLVLFRFNMIEVALALVILAIGLSSVMVLFPVGLKASQASVADNNLGDVAERVAAYLQAKCTSSEVWENNGTFDKNIISDKNFDPEDNSQVTSSDFNTTSDSSQTDDMKGLFRLEKNDRVYYLYQQYSPVGTGGDRAVDFEAIVRIGWDNDTLLQQYYLQMDTGSWTKLSNYSHPSNPSGSDLPNSPLEGLSASEILKKCCRALIIEISWPADVPWANREKRVFRVEMFNDNFVPYPQTTGSGGSTNP